MQCFIVKSYHSGTFPLLSLRPHFVAAIWADLMSSGSQNRHSWPQRANHSFPSFFSTQYSPTSVCLVNYPTRLATIMKPWHISKACPAYLLSSVQPSRMFSSWTLCFCLLDEPAKRPQSDKTALMHHPRSVGRLTRLASADTYCQSWTQHSTAGEGFDAVPHGSWCAA